MGAVMVLLVATANSILVVTFANEQRQFGNERATSRAGSGTVRLRPVKAMTALAMLIGMMPMSLGLGEGGEQKRSASADWLVSRWPRYAVCAGGLQLGCCTHR